MKYMLVGLHKTFFKHSMIFLGGLCMGGVMVAYMISATSYAGFNPTIEMAEMIASDHQVLQRLKKQAHFSLDAYSQKLGSAQAKMHLLENRLLHLVEALGIEDPGLMVEKKTTRKQPSSDHLLDEIHALEERVIHYAQHISAFEKMTRTQSIEDKMTPHGHYTQIAHGWVSSNFGYRNDPFSGKKKWHSGVDIACLAGVEVKAIASGVVKFAGSKGSYGNVIDIDHGQGLMTRYAHNAELLVKKGQLVHKGTPIAKVGKTGRATAPHVHFEVRKNGKAIDPSDFLRRETFA